MGWRKYAVAVLLFNGVGFLAVYALLRLQGVLPLNPQEFAGNTPDSGVRYGGQLRHEHELAELRRRNDDELPVADARADRAELRSAASGMAVLVALIRGLARRTAATIGNFWFDLVRSTVYILLPLSVVVALVSGFAGRHSEFQVVRDGECAAADDGRGRHEA